MENIFYTSVFKLKKKFRQLSKSINHYESIQTKPQNVVFLENKFENKKTKFEIKYSYSTGMRLSHDYHQL